MSVPDVTCVCARLESRVPTYAGLAVLPQSVLDVAGADRAFRGVRALVLTPAVADATTA